MFKRDLLFPLAAVSREEVVDGLDHLLPAIVSGAPGGKMSTDELLECFVRLTTVLERVMQWRRPRLVQQCLLGLNCVLAGRSESLVSVFPDDGKKLVVLLKECAAWTSPAVQRLTALLLATAVVDCSCSTLPTASAIFRTGSILLSGDLIEPYAKALPSSDEERTVVDDCIARGRKLDKHALAQTPSFAKQLTLVPLPLMVVLIVSLCAPIALTLPSTRTPLFWLALLLVAAVCVLHMSMSMKGAPRHRLVERALAIDLDAPSFMDVSGDDGCEEGKSSVEEEEVEELGEEDEDGIDEVSKVEEDGTRAVEEEKEGVEESKAAVEEEKAEEEEDDSPPLVMTPLDDAFRLSRALESAAMAEVHKMAAEGDAEEVDVSALLPPSAGVAESKADDDADAAAASAAGAGAAGAAAATADEMMQCGMPDDLLPLLEKLHEVLHSDPDFTGDLSELESGLDLVRSLQADIDTKGRAEVLPHAEAETDRGEVAVEAVEAVEAAAEAEVEAEATLEEVE
eukprot:PLAT5177.1.p1 GENE.PLAT5177.1~~PLAT5177.1.p1  ORF type:complete len:512 (-),score=232.28 PLAT5177.1:137-1672(-)